MKRKIFLKAGVALAAVLFFSGCKKDNTSPSTTASGKYSKGVFIVNEGNFTHGNASVSFYNRDSMKVTNDLFSKVNARPLGDVAQSMGEENGKYYIVVNNSSKVEVVRSTDFTSVGVIDGLAQPRYFLAVDTTKAYVSQWGANGMDGSLAVVDLTTNSVVKTISTGAGAEKMTSVNNLIYVTNCGGYGNDSTVAVINPSTDKLVTTIKVGYNPQDIVTDKNNKIWVLCGGKWKNDYSGLDKAGALVRINPANNQVELSLSFTSMTGSYDRSSLSINGTKDVLYYTFEGMLYEHPIANTSLTTAPRITREFYNVAVDPSTGIFYGADQRNGTTNGWIIRYNTSYAKIDSFEVSIYPDQMFFN